MLVNREDGALPSGPPSMTDEDVFGDGEAGLLGKGDDGDGPNTPSQTNGDGDRLPLLKEGSRLLRSEAACVL